MTGGQRAVENDVGNKQQGQPLVSLSDGRNLWTIARDGLESKRRRNQGRILQVNTPSSRQFIGMHKAFTRHWSGLS